VRNITLSIGVAHWLMQLTNSVLSLVGALRFLFHIDNSGTWQSAFRNMQFDFAACVS